MYIRPLYVVLAAVLTSTSYALPVSRMISLDEFSAADQESLDYRRCLGLYNLGDYALARQHLQRFLQTYPSSQHKEATLALRGKISSREGDWRAALADFESMNNQQILASIESERLHCLYQLKKYREIERISRDRADQVRASGLEAVDNAALHLFFHSEALLRQLLAQEEQKGPIKRHIDFLADSFRKLRGTEFEAPAESSLAEAYLVLQDRRQAAHCYGRLADISPRLRSFASYQEAYLLADIDPEAASALFLQVWRLGQSEAADSLNAALSLLVSLQCYEEISDLTTELGQSPTACTTETMYYIGVALAKLKDPAAEGYLFEYLGENTSSDDFYVSAAETLMSLAVQLGDEALLNRLHNRLFDDAAEPALCIRTLIYRASLLNKDGRAEQTVELLQPVRLQDLSRRERAAALVQVAIAQYQLKDWHAAFLAYSEASSLCETQSNPQAPLWRGLVDSALKWIDIIPKKSLDSAVIEQVQQQITRAHLQSSLFSDEEKQRHLLVLGEYYLRASAEERVIDLLKDLQGAPLSRPLEISYNYLLARSYRASPEQFVKYGERTLALAGKGSNFTKLHLPLSSAYRDLAKQSQDKSHVIALRSKATQHLLAADAIGLELSTDQLRCLLVYASQEALRPDLLSTDPCSLYTVSSPDWLLTTTRTLSRLPPSRENSIDLALHKSRCLYVNECYADCLDLIEPILAVPSSLNSHPLSLGMELRTLYAASLLHTGRSDEAGAHLEQLRADALRLRDSQCSTRYQILACRMSAAILPIDEWNGSSLITDCIERLKRLQAAKKLEDEPLHLEAALLYVDMSVASAPESEHLQLRTKLLTALKNDFSNKDDLWGRQYQDALAQLPEKRAVYDAYMLLIDAHLSLAQAASAYVRGDQYESQAHMETAEALFTLLKQDKFPVSDYLITQSELWNCELIAPAPELQAADFESRKVQL